MASGITTAAGVALNGSAIVAAMPALQGIPMLRFTLLLMAALLAGCASNPIVDSWQQPGLAKPLQFEKTLMVARLATAADQRLAEEQWVVRLPMAKGQPGYRQLDDNSLQDVDSAKAKVKAAGFRHALVMRLAGSKQEVFATPRATFGISRASFWRGGYGTVGLASSDIETREVVGFELSLYDLEQDQLLWSGNGELTNPGKIASSVDKLANGLIEQWQAQGLLPAATP